jgi:hypothetical protein
MKCRIGATTLALLLALSPMNIGLAAETAASPSGEAAAPGGQAGQPTPADALAANVSEISRYRMMSRERKEKRIGDAVRFAVMSATAYKEPEETLDTAAQLAAAASAAAPEFKDVIIHAVLNTPSVAVIDGAESRIRTAVDEAATAKNATVPSAATSPSPSAGAPPPVPAAPAPTPLPAPPPSEPAATENATAPAGAENGSPLNAAEAQPKQDKSNPWTLPKIDLGENASLHFTADLRATYDDNVFRTNTNEKSDELLSAAPGAVFKFGQNSLTNGSLSYQESFQNYVHHSTTAQELGTGAGTFAYSNDRMDLAAGADYGQFSENQEGFFVPGQSSVVRRDEFDINGNDEVHFTEKTSAAAGVTYSDTHYHTSGLVSNHSYSVPLNVYYSIRPKIDLSAGFTHSEIKTAGNGSGSTQVNRYYNVGARGTFTPKLSGGLTVGYTTSAATQLAKSGLFSFTTNLAYELSPKTNLSLTASRNFNAGPLGEQELSTYVSLGASTAISPQWQANANFNYEHNTFGSSRADDYIGSNLSATYTFSTKIGATLTYGLTKNFSTLSVAEYLDNMVSIDVNLTY